MRIGIYGYGNLGRGVEKAVLKNEDTELVAVFTRRNPKTVNIQSETAEVVSSSDVLKYKDRIDVLIICGGSASDLPEMTPYLAEHFNVIDSFDTHAKIPVHYENVNKSAAAGKKTAIISVGWDPGLFSINRLYASAVLPDGNDYTFWGRGVSQGHSDAIRRIDGVLDARQYTVPCEDAVKSVINGENPVLTPRQKHKRECYVVVKEGADKARIENEIKTMPDYFADYDTSVSFISAEELQKNHSGIPHGGTVIRTGATDEAGQNHHVIEYKLKLDSNPEFTSSVLVSFARACFRMNKRGDFGCKTVFDVAPKDLSAHDYNYIISHLL